MDADDRTLLEKTARLSEENHRMLKKLLSAQRWATFFTILRWLIIIGVAIGAYYVVGPYLESLMEAYKAVLGTGGDGQTTFNASELFKMIQGQYTPR